MEDIPYLREFGYLLEYDFENSQPMLELTSLEKSVARYKIISEDQYCHFWSSISRLKKQLDGRMTVKINVLEYPRYVICKVSVRKLKTDVKNDSVKVRKIDPDNPTFLQKLHRVFSSRRD